MNSKKKVKLIRIDPNNRYKQIPTYHEWNDLFSWTEIDRPFYHVQGRHIRFHEYSPLFSFFHHRSRKHDPQPSFCIDHFAFVQKFGYDIDTLCVANCFRLQFSHVFFLSILSLFCFLSGISPSFHTLPFLLFNPCFSFSWSHLRPKLLCSIFNAFLLVPRYASDNSSI